jgi:hypothetical protein
MNIKEAAKIFAVFHPFFRIKHKNYNIFWMDTKKQGERERERKMNKKPIARKRRQPMKFMLIVPL